MVKIVASAAEFKPEQNIYLKFESGLNLTSFE